MRTKDVLAATSTGLWHWDSTLRTVVLDAEAARLLGLPAESATLTEAALRARFHPVDWVEVSSVVNIAVAEGTLAETRLRVVGDDGEVLRVVRTRSRPYPRGDGYELIGTIQEVPAPQPGTAAASHPRVTGDWRRSREAFLLDAGRALAQARSTSEVLRVTAALSMPGFSPDGLTVFTVEGDRLRLVGYHGYDSEDEAPFLHLSLTSPYPAAEVIRTGRAIYLPSPGEYERRFPETWPLARAFGRKSWAFLPLVVGGRTMGAWMAAFSYPVAFTPDERAILTTIARMLAQALSHASAQESERELATGLQRSMMPTVEPDIPGMTVAARYVPTGGGLQIGGDWYDMIPLPSGRIALVIGDVQGHDVRAAGLMGQLRIALRAYASEGHRPDAVLSRASRFLTGLADQWPDGEGGDDPRFATCLYIEVDPETGTLDIARAGHPDIAIRMTDGTVLIRPTAVGLPLGIDPDADYPTTRLLLAPGESMMVCTDGLIETGGHDMETGWRRLRRIIENYEGDGLESLADALVQAVHGPPSHHMTGPLLDRREDDIALLLLRREGLGGVCFPAEDGIVPRPIRRTVLTIDQAEPEHVGCARNQLRELLHDWPDPEQVDSAVLLVSEIVTNVLTHTDDDALLVAEIAGERGRRRLRVDVSDASDELPRLRRPGELASHGRGLVLTELLAESWGVDPRGEGKCIWFEFYEVSSGSSGSEAEPEPAESAA